MGKGVLLSNHKSSKEYKLEIYCSTKEQMNILIDAIDEYLNKHSESKLGVEPFDEAGKVVQVEHHHFRCVKK